MSEPITKFCITCNRDGHTYLECTEVRFSDLLFHAFGTPGLAQKNSSELKADIDRLGERFADKSHVRGEV